MVIVVALAFILAWSPQYIVSIISQLQTESFLREGNFFFTMLMTHLFGFTNSCINPFIYTLMSVKFRNCFKAVFANISDCCRTDNPGFHTILFSRHYSDRCEPSAILNRKTKHSYYGSSTNITCAEGDIVINMVVMRNGDVGQGQSYQATADPHAIPSSDSPVKCDRHGQCFSDELSMNDNDSAKAGLLQSS